MTCNSKIRTKQIENDKRKDQYSKATSRSKEEGTVNPIHKTLSLSIEAVFFSSIL